MAEFKHKGCGGRVVADVTSLHSVRTPSIILNPREVKLGVLELRERTRGGRLEFVCLRCEESFAMEDKTEGITSMCLTCSRQKPLEQLFVSHPFPVICKTCKDELCGTGKTKNADLAAVFSLSASTIEFTPLLDILKKPIS